MYTSLNFWKFFSTPRCLPPLFYLCSFSELVIHFLLQNKKKQLAFIAQNEPQLLTWNGPFPSTTPISQQSVPALVTPASSSGVLGPAPSIPSVPALPQRSPLPDHRSNQSSPLSHTDPCTCTFYPGAPLRIICFMAPRALVVVSRHGFGSGPVSSGPRITYSWSENGLQS